MMYNMGMTKELYVTKADGTREIFDSKKLFSSLQNSGVSKTTAVHIVEHISKEIDDGMSTSMIRDHANFLLGRMEKPAGARYSDRKSTRLNSSHSSISYAVFCLETN